MKRKISVLAYGEQETGNRRLQLFYVSGCVSPDHILEDSPQLAVKQAIQVVGIAKHGSCHTMRHSFASYVQLGWRGVRTTLDCFITK